MTKIKVAVHGYGNIGHFAIEAVLAAPDMELVGLIRRQPSLADIPPHLQHITLADNLEKLGGADVVLLATPSRNTPEIAQMYLQQGTRTVDSFDIHTEIPRVRHDLGQVAKEHHSVAVLGAGWDPGTDSILRTVLEMMAPRGLTYTNFGPGMSMGHTVAVKHIPGVKDALSLTIPKGSGQHRRDVYIELEKDASYDDVQQAIRTDPYFVHDETHVFVVPDVKKLIDRGHGVIMERKGVSGQTDNQWFQFQMRIHNPALTAQIMVSAARAAMRLSPGAYTLIEIPPIFFLPGAAEEHIARLV